MIKIFGVVILKVVISFFFFIDFLNILFYSNRKLIKKLVLRCRVVNFLFLMKWFRSF